MTTTPVQPIPNEIIAQQQFDRAFTTTQGYILRGHKRNRVGIALLQFKQVEPAMLRTALEKVAQNLMSGTELNQERNSPNADVTVWAMGLTWPGYQAIGLQDPNVFNSEFRDGFANRVRAVTGRGREDWNSEQWPSKTPYHAVVIVAAGINDDVKKGERLLGQAKEKIQESFENLSTVTWLHGNLNREADGRLKENFGFADGVSQPRLTANVASPQSIAADPFNASASLRLALIEEPYPGGDKPEYGSYLALLKIEQHIGEFTKAAQEFTSQLGLTSDPQCVAAKQLIIGRKINGQSLIPGAGLNDFDATASGDVWPYACHSRKMNPRTDEAKARRIVRRSCLYKEEDRVGVLFQSFQSSFREQFEFLFSNWANNPDQPHKSCGVDPLVGYDPSGSQQQWPNGKGGKVSVAIRGLTTVRGGEYFYFPSIPSLQHLNDTFKRLNAR